MQPAPRWKLANERATRVLRHDESGLATLTFNRPGKLNALDSETCHELDAQLANSEGQHDTIGSVVLRGVSALAGVRAIGPFNSMYSIVSRAAFSIGECSNAGSLSLRVLKAIIRRLWLINQYMPTPQPGIDCGATRRDNISPSLTARWGEIAAVGIE